MTPLRLPILVDIYYLGRYIYKYYHIETIVQDWAKYPCRVGSPMEDVIH